jgi:triphosphatase
MRPDDRLIDLPATRARLRPWPRRISARMDAASGFRAIASGCLGQLVVAYPSVIAGGDPEAVHRTRVAIRRLRAAASLFRRVADDAQAPVLRAELKAAHRELAPARDLRVLIERVADAEEVVARLVELESAATRSAADMLSGAAFQQLLLQLADWIGGREWRTRGDGDAAGQPLTAFAERALSRRRRQLRRHGDDLAAMTDHDRHALRIDVRKLRYATDFLAPVFCDEPMRSRQAGFSRALATLQNRLGDLNDLALAADGGQELIASLDPITRARLAAQLIQSSRAQHGSRQRALKRAQEALDRVSRLPAWWKAD